METLEKSVEITTMPFEQRRANMDQYDSQEEQLRKQGAVLEGDREIDKRYTEVTKQGIGYFMTHFIEEEQLQVWYDKLPAEEKAKIDQASAASG
jgi:hypothetical protein